MGPSRLSDSSNSSSSLDSGSSTSSGSGSSSSDSSDPESGQKALFCVCVGKASFSVSIYCSTCLPRISVTLVGLLHVEGSIPVLLNVLMLSL